MVIKATFKAGETSIKVNALHQWDYGQRLEIEAEDLPQIFEVHFACKDMTEAVVVSCAANDGVGIVTIPNRCLEQSKPITAWIYEIDGEQGTTTKTISIPIVARVRPSKTDEIPQAQPLCYCKDLTLIDCTMEGCDLSFEYSEVDATVNGHIDSVKNVKSGRVVADSVGEIVSSDAVMECIGEIIIR